METITKRLSRLNRHRLVKGLLGLAAIVSICIQYEQRFNAKIYSPVLPLLDPSEDFRPVVFALRDPLALKRKPEDDGDAERLAQEIKEIRTGIERLTGPRAIEQNEQAYLGLAALSYYFQDQVRKSDQPTVVAQGKQNFQNTAALLEQHASATARLAGDSRTRARAQYHFFASRYSRSGLSSSGVKEILDNLRGLSENQSLPNELKQRTVFVLAHQQIAHQDPKVRSKAHGQMLSIGRRVDPLARVGAYLHLAKNARKIANGQPDAYKKYLMQASLKSAPLTPAEKSEVLRHLVSIWRSQDKKALTWEFVTKPAGNGSQGGAGRIPFNLSPFKDSLEAMALSERMALAAWQQKDESKALARYERLSRLVSDRPQWIAYKAALDMRTLDLRRAQYLGSETQSRPLAARYEKSLVSKEKEYLDLGVLGPQRQGEAQSLRAQIVSYRRELAHRELDRSKGNSSHGEAIRIAEGFLNDHQDDADRIVLREKIASSYVAWKNYDPAVSIYRELAEGSQGPQKRRYLTLAIGAQSLRADWPTKVPWDTKLNPIEDSLTHRELLKSLYLELQKLSPQDWFVAAHIGHLDIHVGQGEKAFKDWQLLIAKTPRDYHASQAAGWMFVAYERAKSWAQLEQLARLCLKVGVTGLYRNDRINPQVKLAQALLESGKEYFAQQNFPLSVKKLKEFTYLNPTPVRHDEGFFTLTLAYWGNKQYRESVETTLNFVEAYPRSSYTRQALLNGGDWSTILTYEENALSLHGQFLKRYPNDPQAPRVRQSLYELTMGRELYGEALELLAEEQKSHKSKGDFTQVAQTEAKMMALEENHGSINRALYRAKNLIASAGASDEIKANAYRMMLRNSAKQGQSTQIKQYLTQLDNLGDSQERREAKAEGLLMVANLESKSAIKEYFNLELKDPYGTLQERFRVFSRQKNNYLSVCAVGANASCAPALHQLARLSENFGASLEDLSVQKTLAKSEVDRFQKSKQAILTSIARTTIEADQRSLQHTMMSSRGPDSTENQGTDMTSSLETDPQWVEGVNWQNEANWTSARPQGIGSGFLQWSEKRAGVAP